MDKVFCPFCGESLEQVSVYEFDGWVHSKTTIGDYHNDHDICIDDGRVVWDHDIDKYVKRFTEPN